ncbi:baseplate wedge subunit [Paraglaciecola Antarctic GD virus 1]|nr:baseplate wedge subunit [Paraglaciecola Antarctic GD virus 1]
MVAAPQITGLKAGNVSANYVNLQWDNLGGFFVYRVERSLAGAEIWAVVGSTSDDNFWDDSFGTTPLIPETSYDYRVFTTGEGFSESLPTFLYGVLTFSSNLYSILTANKVTPYLSFVNNKLVNDNDPEYVDFNNDEIRVALTNSSYVYNTNHTNLQSLVADGSILSNKSNPKRYGLVPQMCTTSFGTHSLIISNDVTGTDTLLILEERQRVSLTSLNYGESYNRANVVDGDVVGSPSANGIACGNDDNTFVLGYDNILSLYDGTGSKSYNDINGGEDLSATFDPTLGHRFYNYGSYPAGVASGTIQAITCDDNKLYAVANGAFFQSTTLGSTLSWAGGVSILNQGSPIDTKCATTRIESFNGYVFVLVIGQFNDDGKITQYDNSATTIPYPDDDTEQGSLFTDIGLYRYSGGTWVKMYGITDEERKKFTLTSSISRSSTDIILSLDSGAAKSITINADGVDNIDLVGTTDDPEYENDDGLNSNSRSYRTVYYSTDGDVFNRGQERFRFEEHHIYVNGERTWTDFNRRFARLTNNTIQTKIVSNTFELWDSGVFEFKADDVVVNDFSGTATGAIIYSKGANNLEGNLVAFYSFGSLQRGKATIDFPFDRVLINAVLTNRILSEDEVAVINKSRYVHPSLAPLIQKMIPEDYIQDGSMYNEFIKEYLRFMSDDNDSVYGTMDRLLWNQDVNETELMDKFFGDLYQRNIYVSEEKRQLVNKFFTNTNHDFNSIKGTLDSYKYMFKLLYDVDIEVGLESTNNFEFFIDVDTNDFDDALIGSTIVSPTGSANITYSTIRYRNGVAYYEFTLNNIYGEINIGDSLTSIQVANFAGTATSSVTGKDSPSDADQFASRLKSYYTVTVKSPIPVGIYQNTILKYVHPLGFNFLGIYLIISTVNSGLSIAHNTTEFRGLFEYRWSAGVPDVYPSKVPNLDGEGNYKYTLDQPYYRIGYNDVSPNGGGSGVQRVYLVKTPSEFEGGDPYPLPETHYVGVDQYEEVSYSDKYNTILRDKDSDQRRETKSPTFDQSNQRFFDFVDWTGNPGITTLSINIQSDDVTKSCNIASTQDRCSNTFVLTSTVTDFAGEVTYAWSVASGNATISDPTQDNVTVQANGEQGENDIITVICSITDDVSSDSDSITLSSSYERNSEAIQARIIKQEESNDNAVDLEQFASYRSATSTSSFDNVLNDSDNRMSSRVSKDGKFAVLPFHKADQPSANNAGMVVVYENLGTESTVARVEQKLFSQTPVDDGRYGLAVDIADANGKYRIFASDYGHAFSTSGSQISSVDIWDLVGSTWERIATIDTLRYIGVDEGDSVITAFQDGFGFLLSNAELTECYVFRSDDNWATFTEYDLGDPVYNGNDVSYFGDFVIKLTDLDPPSNLANPPNDLHLFIHKWNGTNYTDDKFDLGPNDGNWEGSVSINDAGSVFVAPDGRNSGAYVYEGDYPNYTRTLLDRSSLVSYGWDSRNTIAMGSDVTRSGNEVSVAYSSPTAFAESENGGVVIYAKDIGSWVASSYTVGMDEYGVNHHLSDNDLAVTQGNTLRPRSKTIFFGLDNLQEYSTPEQTCNFDAGSSCGNDYVFGAEASGGSGGYFYNWALPDSNNFVIDGADDEKIVRVRRVNASGNTETEATDLTLRVTDAETPSLGDPQFFDEDELEITSTHISGLDPNVTVAPSSTNSCYYPAGGACTITYAINSAPSGGIGPYNISWSKTSSDALFVLSGNSGEDITVTIDKPAGASPQFEAVGIKADVTDDGSTSTGTETVDIQAIFLEIVGGTVESGSSENASCNYETGSCTNSWELTALPTGGYDTDYEYNWVKVSGDPQVVLVGPIDQPTANVESENDADVDGTFSAVFKCEIVDGQDPTNTGDTSSITLTSTHEASATTQANMSSIPTQIFAGGAWGGEGSSVTKFIRFNPDGTWEVVGNQNDAPNQEFNSGTWASGTVTTTDYEIFVTESDNQDSITIQDATGSFIPINTTRRYGIRFDEYGVGDKTYDIQIREIANNSNTDSVSIEFTFEQT